MDFAVLTLRKMSVVIVGQTDLTGSGKGFQSS